ncbi:low choriolytic enzyme-like [Nothobranchius furzeri]|uniref:Metalloendopeptidase n=1 Tax=Nothobranchius furzeri TaxID=105023 RepID=A0A9D2Y2H2_NOTFU|nr:low choriolytic enzyme-like [Nothobranchius furzeri]
MHQALLLTLLLSVPHDSLVRLILFPSDEPLYNSDPVPRPKTDLKALTVYGDIAVANTINRNADLCTARGCKWPKSGAFVYVPYYISPQFGQEEQMVIIKALQSFNQTSCIRLVPWKPGHRDYLYFESMNGCWSLLGRQDGGQYISLQKGSCVYHRTVQHEVLHALGFDHEQVRSDRDDYVQILFENIQEEFKFAFEKKITNNLGTPYDFYSVMEYDNYAFTKNQQPTILARIDPYLPIGNAREMSVNDITRINRLYQCGYGIKGSASRNLTSKKKFKF